MTDTAEAEETKAVVVIREKPITKRERTRYKTLLKEVKESIEAIEHHLLKLSHDLREIQKDRLYREHYDSFEAFIGAELGKGRAYGYRLIKAYDVLDGLLDEGIRAENLPNTERLCRELARIKDPKMRKNLWERVQLMCKEEDKEIDATIIHDVIDEDEEAKERLELVNGGPLTVQPSGDSTEDKLRNTKQIKEVIDLFQNANKDFTISLNFDSWEQSELSQFSVLVDAICFRTAKIREQIQKHSLNLPLPQFPAPDPETDKS
jgi:hypothetical protein